MPTRGIGTASFAVFSAEAEKNNLRLLRALGRRSYNNTRMFSSSVEGFRQLRELYARWRKLDLGAAGPVLGDILKTSGYLSYAESRKDDKQRDRILDDLYELVEAAHNYDKHMSGKKKNGGLRGYLEHTQLMQQDDKDDDPNKVMLMTAHAAKGLEFRNVFVVGCVDGIMPLHPRPENGVMLDAEVVKQHYEEERRVFFVAVTRAEERLWLTLPCMRRSYGGQPSPCKPSQFLAEGGLEIEGDSYVRPATQYTKQPITPKPNSGGVDEIIRQRLRSVSKRQVQADLQVTERERLRRLAIRGSETRRPSESDS
jgi:DNA helicase-2/ATP-dependent DNA helicase PcrA